MKYLITLLAVTFAAFASPAYETHETNWSFSIKTNYIPDINTNYIWNVKPFTNSFIFTNSIQNHLVVIEPGNYEDFTNFVIMGDYKGTIQVGTNFYHINTITNMIVTKELTK